MNPQHCSVLVAALLGVSGLVQAAPVASTPIEHVIVIVGENRTFDNLFGT